MKTKAMLLVAAVMAISATTTVFAADSMSHDMQRDLHVRMGMAAEETKPVAPTETGSVTHMNHDMQSDLHVRMGMAVNDSKNNSASIFKAATDPKIYIP